ncbi:MAG: Lrp/AsnC family transcriptional regulator [Armatimonadota bacterium]
MSVDAPGVPAGISDPVNARILQVSEDRIAGFQPDPFGAIAAASGESVETVLSRIRAMLEAGTVRRVRQTLLATSLAPGALVAWRIAPEKLHDAFDWLFERDPFSGHVVIRSTDADTPGSVYRLWTTLKVPQGYSVAKHAEFLRRTIGADSFRLMPAKRLFALGVGHLRRRSLEVGSMAEVPAEPRDAVAVRLSDLEWRVLGALKRELDPGEVRRDVWRHRAEAAGMDPDVFLETARALDTRGVIGRFSTFLEHVKPTADNERVTRYNALFHWAVPPGRENEAGCEVGRFHCMTHAYWREGGPEFANVNVMGVAHGVDKELVLANKAAIDSHLARVGIPVSYTNVFWGGRSEIKPSEILPAEYAAFCAEHGLDPLAMRDEEGGK